jgi:hypothetical protein
MSGWPERTTNLAMPSLDGIARPITDSAADRYLERQAFSLVCCFLQKRDRTCGRVPQGTGGLGDRFEQFVVGGGASAAPRSAATAATSAKTALIVAASYAEGSVANLTSEMSGSRPHAGLCRQMLRVYERSR